MIQNITIKIQEPLTTDNSNFSNSFISLLKNCKNVYKIDGEELFIGNNSLKPITHLSFSKQATAVSFNDDSKNSFFFKTHGLTFGENVKKEFDPVYSNNKCTIRKDSIGEYCEVEINKIKYFQLTIEQLLQRFKGKLNEVNHLGINFSPSEINEKNYLEFKNYLAKKSFLAKYPTDEEWPFIIPCTEEEFKTDITDFSIKRNPKFEIVYSKSAVVPQIQFDVESVLSKEEIIKLLPEPYGVSFDGLEDYFRTVFIFSCIGGVVIRFDIRFPSKNGKDFYPWMIEEGGRIVG